MAVWGTPAATEDDAERAVRAALDLVAAVSALGDELGARRPARSGRRAHGRGGGDARRRRRGDGRGRPRQHGLADPVGRRARAGARRRGDPARDRADDRLRGRRRARAQGQDGRDAALAGAAASSPGARGALKSHGPRGAVRRPRPRAAPDQGSLPRLRGRAPRPPRVGDRASPGSASRASAWEFYKYFDGLAEHVYWHRGRCLSYGEGVTYWALADMVRMRCRIAEDEPAAAALAKLARRCDEHIARRGRARASSSRGSRTCSASTSTEPRPRRTCSRPGGCSSSGSRRVPGRARSSRTCSGPTRRLLDFIEYLLEWSRNQPLFVVTLARPELHERRPAGARGSATSRRSTSSRCRGGDGGAARGPRARAARRRCATRSWPAPRACRSTRSRRCACCSTAARSCAGRRRLPAASARSTPSRCRRRCTR